LSRVIYIYQYVPIQTYYLTIMSEIEQESVMPRKKPDKEVERVLYTFAEAQEFLRVSHQTLYNLVKEGLPSHKIGNNRMFLKDDLIKWISDH
jgi:excisionase family DNA binding protein